MTVQKFLEALRYYENPDFGPILLNAPLTDDEMTRWQQAHPQFTLPTDLLALYKMHNGIRIFADEGKDDWDGNDGFPILLPLRRVQYAARTMYLDNTEVDVKVPNAWLALSTDKDSSAFIVLDTATGSYLDVDPIGLEPSKVASNVPELLDWICDRYLVNA